MSTFIHIPVVGEPDVFTLPVGWTDVNLAELMRCGPYNPRIVIRQEKKPLTYHGSHTFIHALLSHPFVIVYVQQNSMTLNNKFKYKGHINVIGNVGIVVPAEIIKDIAILTELTSLGVRTQLREAVKYDHEIREEAVRRLAAEKKEADIRAMMETLRG
jgi:hypothetical protein